MNQPKSFWDQLEGKATAELYRGSGIWPPQEYPVDLEPPFDEWLAKSPTVWDCFVNDWHCGFKTGLFGRRVPSRTVLAHDQPIVIPEATWGDDWESLVPVTVEQFQDDEATIDKADQFLRSLTSLYRPAVFEIIGLGARPRYNTKLGDEILRARAAGDTSRKISDAIASWSEPSTSLQFVVHRGDAPTIRDQLLAQYPNSAIVDREHLQPDHDPIASDDLENGYVATFRLSNAYIYPLRRFSKLDPDPLGVVIAAFEQLGQRDWGLVQIAFVPTRRAWPELVSQAVSDPYKTGAFLFNDIDRKTLDDKFSCPLFAVSIRVAARRKGVFEQLLGWINQFAQPPQELVPVDNLTFNDGINAIVDRTTYRPGMILSSRELASLVHLCAHTISSERLKTVPTRTRPAPQVSSSPGSVILGHNVHRGRKRIACIPANLRSRHLYVAGASGTGKSTLLLNLIKQDVDAGVGVGVLDPHGDLILDVLSVIPKQRVKDVVLFDPTDVDFPPALNILHARDQAERDRLVSEVVDTLEKFSTSPWGARFAHIFKHALATILRFKNSTLWDVRRILIDNDYRNRCLSRLRDPTLLSFWNNEWPKLPRGAVDPVLNRLGPFLMSANVRNILCQREVLLDFDQIINRGRILLCNLSTGLLTKPVSGVFGTFIMSKLINATFRRAALPRDQRRRFNLYVDEFQSLMGQQLSVGFEDILAEARKYALTLSVANQYVDQLTPAVRQAVFGNVGTLMTFRLGVKDARLVADEFGAFTEEEIMSLELGQAIARVGGTQTAYNIETLAPPKAQEPDLTTIIRARCRRYFARPKAAVEKQIMGNNGEAKASAKADSKRRAKPMKTVALTSPEPPSTTDDDTLDLWGDYVR